MTRLDLKKTLRARRASNAVTGRAVSAGPPMKILDPTLHLVGLTGGRIPWYAAIHQTGKSRARCQLRGSSNHRRSKHRRRLRVSS